MTKLISADIPRVLRSKILYIILLLTVIMGVASVLVVFSETDEAKAVFPIASNNLVLFLSMLMPVFSGGLSIMLISGEFTSGVIRNKFIMGHSRRSVLMSWAAIYSATTLLTFIVYVGAFFLSLNIFGADLSGIRAGDVAVNLLILMLFVMKFQMFSFLMTVIYPDAKTAVICYILNNATIVPLMLASMSEKKSWLMKFLSRILILGYTNGDYTLMTKPDKPWLTALMIVALGAVYLILAEVHFRKKDLK